MSFLPLKRGCRWLRQPFPLLPNTWARVYVCVADGSGEWNTCSAERVLVCTEWPSVLNSPRTSCVPCPGSINPERSSSRPVFHPVGGKSGYQNKDTGLCNIQENCPHASVAVCHAGHRECKDDQERQQQSFWEIHRDRLRHSLPHHRRQHEDVSAGEVTRGLSSTNAHNRV